MIQGRYLIRNLIGKGGMGQVYLAVDQRLRNSVALKRTTVGDDPSLAVAFEHEARTLAQLRHPYLPKVSDHFIEGDEQFLVMEYIEGDDLSERLKSLRKPFPLNWVLFWADELLEALTYLHTQDPPIIHRDIKPQNLKLTGDNHIVLLDFGLSKHSVAQTKVTTSGSVVGYTPHYAPMEQIRGTGTNALSDIYALSATLYHLLSGRVPPDALTRADALLGGEDDPIRPLTELNGEVTEVISDAVLRGMELNQARRFPSAREMQKTLRKAYNELQKSMSAETVAFNIGDINAGDDGDGESISGERTEVMRNLPVPPAEPEPQAPAVSADVDFDKTEVIDTAQMREIAELDVSHAPDEAEPSMAGDKTEVMRGQPAAPMEDADTADFEWDSSEASSYETAEEIYAPDQDFKTSEDIGPAVGSYKTSEDFDGSEFKTSEDFDGSEYKTSEEVNAFEADPDATVAGIALGGFESDSTPTAVPQGEETSADAGEIGDFGFTEQFTAEETGAAEPDVEAEPFSEVEEDDEPEVSAPIASGVSAAEGESEGTSTGKLIAILLGLGAVLVLVLGSVAVVGWYLLGDGLGGGSATPVPTASTPIEELTPEFTPVPETPEVTPTVSPEESPSPEASPTATAAPTRTPVRTPPRTPSRTPTRTPVRTPPKTPTPVPSRTPRTLPTILQ